MNSKILIVRGRYFNRYELQNYEPLLADDYQIYGVSSLFPIHKHFPFPLFKLPSPVDLPNFPYKMPILNRLFLGDAMYLFGLENVVKKIKPDIAHGRETYFHFTYQLAKLRSRGVIRRLIVTVSETRPFNHEGIWRRSTIKAFVRQHTDIFHALTVKAKKALIAEGVPEEKIKIIHYGVNQKLFFPEKSSFKRNRTLRLLFVGRLVEEKGVRDLIKIYSLLRKQKIDFSLKIIGDGPLKKLLTKHKLSASKVAYSFMPSVYRNNDILLSLSKTTPYWEELFGMNLVEAQSSAVVPLAYNSGAVKEVVGFQHLLVREGDWQGIVKKIIELAENHRLLREWKTKVYRRANKEFNASQQAQKLKILYQ